MKRYFTAFYALLLAFVPSACATHGQSAMPVVPASDTQNLVKPFDMHGGIATVGVAVGDAVPGFFANQLANINLAISEIDVVDRSGRSLVVAQYPTPLVVDLLQYQDGSGENIGQASVSQLTFAQVRFVIDAAASSAIYTGGVSVPLSFVSADDNSSANAGRSTSTTRLDARHVVITEKRTFTVASVNDLVNVDFNLMESLTPPSIDSDRGQSNHVSSDTHGGLSLTVRPTLFLAANSNAGQITGTIVNNSGRPVSNATVVAVGQGNDVGNTISTNASGKFLLHTLGAGTYRLDIYNQYQNSAGANFSSEGSSSDKDRLRGPTVTVSPGQTSNAGTITD